MSLLGPIVSLCFLCLLLPSTSSTSVKLENPPPQLNCTSPNSSECSISQNAIETSLKNGTQSAPHLSTTSINQLSPDVDPLNKSKKSSNGTINVTQLNLANISPTKKPFVQPSISSPTVSESATSVTDVPLSQTENNELNASPAVVPSNTTEVPAYIPQNSTGTTLPTTHSLLPTTLATTPTQKTTEQASKTAPPFLPPTKKTPSTTPSPPTTKATTISPSMSSPKPITPKPAVQITTSLSATISSTTAPPLSSVVEMAGGDLTKQLVDRATLFAILLFGLLFFFVVVAVFATQAYESYRKKDYTQVDYLINGMYADSGV